MDQLAEIFKKYSPYIFGALLLVGCGSDMAMSDDGDFGENEMEAPGTNGAEEGWNHNMDPGENEAEGAPPDEHFEPEEEEFLVQKVAATDSYVFVPNQSEDSDTVALIDGWDFSVHPIRVGQEPVQVVAADVDEQGAVGYVLSVGTPTVSIIRADQGTGDDRADVRVLTIPPEVNQLALSPDGKHVLAYIDPSEPINDSASAASLQTMALIRLADEPGEDEVYELSVTRLIDDIAFTADGDQAFIVGEEGINRLPLREIKSDAFLPSINLDMSSSVFSPQDQEVAFSSDGTVMTMRTSQYAGVGLFELDPEETVVDSSRMIDLPGVPTDLDLVERDDGTMLAVATIRGEGQIALFEVGDALEAEEGDDSFVRFLDAGGADAGIGRLTPDETAMVVFSTLPEIPTVGLLDLESETIETYELRNEIRNLEISPDSRTAVVVHQAQGGPTVGGDPEAAFRQGEGITLWDLETGYRRPIALKGEPEEILMTTDAAGTPYLYVMLTSSNPNNQGVRRINLRTHGTDFLRLPRHPLQLGAVAEQIFVSQESDTGRITFMDVETNQQRTVSGYELNAGIQ